MPSKKKKNLLKETINVRFKEILEKSENKDQQKAKSGASRIENLVEYLIKENNELRQALKKFVPSTSSSSPRDESNYYSSLMDLTDECSDTEEYNNGKAEPKIVEIDDEDTFDVLNLKKTPTKKSEKEKRPSTINSLHGKGEKMPPINMFDTRVDRLKCLIKNKLGIKNFAIKEHSEKHSSLYTYDMEDFKKARALLEDGKIDHFTFTPKTEKKKTLILKGLNSLYSPEEVLHYLKEQETTNIKFEKVTRLTTKHSINNGIILPHYIVQASADSLTNDIMNIKVLDYQIVRWEKLIKTHNLQCTKCQRFSHSAANCYMQLRCVKCGNNHRPEQCSISAEDPRDKLYCTLCGNHGHPASYTKCPVHIKKMELRQKIRDNAKQNIFSALLERDVVANNSMYLRAITVFVPTNKAFQSYKGSSVEVLYHMSTTPYEKDQLPKPPTPVVSDMGGNPPLHITRNREGEIFVNNARLIPGRSIVMNNNATKGKERKQVMHVIEEVLEPLTTLPTAKIDVTNPDAMIFLQNADSMNIENHRLRTYRSQVSLMKKEKLFFSPGGHTFLMPVDDGFKSQSRSSLVDGKVIDGHVIPNNVLFTSAVPLDSRYTSEAYADNLKVTISFFMQENKMYVKSITTVGDTKHPVGVVMAEIVKANIPVRNGVVHLIQRPLMIVDTTVDQFLKDNENGALYKFHQAIMETGGDILDDITRNSEVTILAPSNEAWTRSNLTDFAKHKEKVRELLKLHVMKGRIDVEQIRNKNAMVNLEESQLGAAQWPTISNKTYLYFNIKEDPDNTVITVEGGGVNATLIQPDVAQTNGFVHIIDRVLGVPYKTILMKLEEDPMLKSTYSLGQHSKFNEQLNGTFAVYTYFVATNKAWENVNLKYPSTHKKLFMRDFTYHSTNILQRHLLLADHAFTIEELFALSAGNNKVVLPTVRDSLSLSIEKESEQYFFYWRNIKIKIVRPNIECTNGIIHVIDIPILEPGDVRNTMGGTNKNELAISAFIANILIIYLVKFLS